MFEDFSLKTYKELLIAAGEKGYTLTSLIDYLTNNYEKVIILRHDVDKKPKHSLLKAILEKELNVKASYYFRMTSESFNIPIIKKIKSFGHEIGYHYEELTLCKGNYEKAIELFRKNLKKFRTISDIKTICMHGSPLSKWDNKSLWNKYNYKNYEIEAEPYFDLNFNYVYYLTDTGMKWSDNSISVRDKVKTNYDFHFNSTKEIIEAIRENKLPEKIMINTHPQRWNDNKFLWAIEYSNQITKNIIKKYFLIKDHANQKK